MAKSVTLKHIGFHFEGLAMLNLWGGGQGQVNMNSWKGQSDSPEVVAQGVNDGQFGCESIDSAEVDVYDLYEKGHKEFKETLYFEHKELKEAKRGI